MRYLLDTCAVSEWTKPRPHPAWLEWTATVPENNLYLSVISVAEIRFGIQRLPSGLRRERFENWLALLSTRFGARFLGVDVNIADAWGSITARRPSIGQPIGAMDAMIAATALVHDLTLVTRDAGGFRDCGIPVVNPWT